MKVRTQHFPHHRAKRCSVSLISLDVFLIRARKLSHYTQTHRQLLMALLTAPVVNCEGDSHSLTFTGPAEGETTVFWLEE